MLINPQLLHTSSPNDSLGWMDDKDDTQVDSEDDSACNVETCQEEAEAVGTTRHRHGNETSNLANEQDENAHVDAHVIIANARGSDEGESSRKNFEDLQRRDNMSWLTKERDQLHDGEKCCVQCKNENMLLLSKVNELILIVEENNNILKNIKQKNIRGCICSREIVQAIQKFNLLPDFPLDDVAELEVFNASLETQEDVKSEFVMKVSMIKNNTLQTMISRILQSLITDKLANRLTWSIKNPNKLKICDLDIVKVIVDTLQSNPEADYKNDEKMML
ncbi:uncharacterized protein LOC131669732 [Phymastichus coffea]|uniref:uncharacterized protein LOC131669732 n=1 Tax=Phymastichus coffea TaxID=108790 RepID=UPI00273A7C66|nr:uncharacterized protein LOC131669732 [Phymastichus coffea]